MLWSLSQYPQGTLGKQSLGVGRRVQCALSSSLYLLDTLRGGCTSRPSPDRKKCKAQSCDRESRRIRAPARENIR